MKKTPLVTQILIIYTSALVAMTLISAFFLVPALEKDYLQQSYDQINYQLEEYISGSSGIDRRYTMYTRQSNGNLTTSGSNSMMLRSDNVISTITNFDVASGASGNGFLDITSSEQEVLFGYHQVDNKLYFAVMLGDAQPIMGNTTLLFQVIGLASVAFLLPLAGVFIWSLLVAKSIKNINHSVKNKSKGIIISTELESLSSSIEEYKTEIAANQKEKQILFQNISHELKTPITNIRSYAEGLEDGMFAPSEIPGASKVIQEEAARLLGSLNQVMELNRLNYHKEEKVSPSVNSVDLSVIISTIKNEIKVTNPGVEIVSDYDCSKVNGDSSSWNTIIKNIFSNNIRHGATKISITGTCHRLMIENNGESIPEELLHRLFTPFVKGEKGSYGLGLSIIKTALELNGYSITIENISKGVRYLITKNSK